MKQTTVGENIEGAGYYTPNMIRHADMIGLVWREPSGYCYKIIHPDTASGPQFGNSTNEDEKSTLSNCARHMAQLTGNYSGLERFLNDADRRDLDRYFQWEANYVKARAEGLTDEQARNVA